MMTMKVLYEKGSLRILGAQIVGYEGVDKRIDVLATAMQDRGGRSPTSRNWTWPMRPPTPLPRTR